MSCVRNVGLGLLVYHKKIIIIKDIVQNKGDKVTKCLKHLALEQLGETKCYLCALGLISPMLCLITTHTCTPTTDSLLILPVFRVFIHSMQRTKLNRDKNMIT